MPTYLYTCHSCDCNIERICSIKQYSEDPVAKCPECNKKATRIIEPPMIMRDASWGNLFTPDGVDISSRNKHRDYMKKHNLVPADDFKETWAKAREERDKHFTDGSDDKKARREAVAKATHQILGS